MVAEPILSSSASFRKSLEAIRNGKAGLSDVRKAILNKVPNSGDDCSFERDSVTPRDIAYLSAATGDEFALLRGKDEDIVFHGKGGKCQMGSELVEQLRSRRYRLVAHTHPDYGEIVASAEDREFLKYIGQKSSLIISYITGTEVMFEQNLF